MDSLNQVIFDDKSFGDLLKEIHGNQKKKATQIASMIAELRPLITSLGDATVVVPLIKEYLEIGVRNDEQLIKMATIIQRAVNNTGKGDDFGISEAEKDELLAELDKLNENLDNNKEK